jgi:dienelactone hydrolase
VSAGIGATFWAATGEPMAVTVAVGAGVLNDTDHLLDYYLWYIKKDVRRLYLLLHGWEYCAAAAIFALVAGNHTVLLAAAIANAGHLLGDYIAHKPKSPLTYSLFYRAAVRFERVRLVRRVAATAHRRAGPQYPLVESHRDATALEIVAVFGTGTLEGPLRNRWQTGDLTRNGCY